MPDGEDDLMTTDKIISRCYEHGQPDYVLAADRLKELQAECKELREANNTWVALFGLRKQQMNDNYIYLTSDQCRSLLRIKGLPKEMYAKLNEALQYVCREDSDDSDKVDITIQIMK